MVWKAALALVAMQGGMERLQSEMEHLKGWIEDHSPYGIDVYPDGTVWISASEDASGTEYGLQAKDVKALAGGSGYVWLLSNHKADKSVPYRTSKSRLHIDCHNKTMRTALTIRYMADGRIHSQERDNSVLGYFEAPVPGSMGELWLELACQR